VTNTLVKILAFFVILLIAGYAQLQEKTDKRITELEKQVTTLKQELICPKRISP
jgi:hypothetical protein